MRGVPYRKEEIAYLKKLYREGVKLKEISMRFEAEFGRKIYCSTISRYGGRRYKKKRPLGPNHPQYIESTHSAQQPLYCQYCGNKLRG